MNKLVSSEKINILKVNIVNFIEQVMITLQKMYSILMMSISKFFKQAKIYAKDNINTIFSYSFFKGLFVKIFMLLFSCWIYNDLEPAIREFILKHISDKLILISNIVENNLSVNIFIVIVICIACYQLCCKIWRNIYYSVSRLLVGSFLLFVLSFEEFWDYNKLPLIDFYYDDLFRSVICIMLVVDILKTIVYSYCKIKKYNSQKGKVFFTNDKIENLGEGAIRKLYAKSIVNQLLNTDTKKESFALAITGEWGSGKSTFLKCMKDEIKLNAKAYIMEFNPWNSMSPQTLIEDYFHQLNNFVSPIYSPLEKSLFSYAHALTQVDIDQNLTQLIKLIPNISEKSLDKLKGNVEKGLKQLDKPILVVIDDIDRLEKEELFEVLRLIRNTGNFTNLIYLVAYDEKYVTQQLKHKDIYDGRLFLEKIFVTQVALPKVDLTEVFLTFKTQLRSMVKKSTWINSCLDKLQSYEIENIKRALYSYRRAKHFARQLSTSAIFLYDYLGKNRFSLHDLLFIELLRFLSPSLYDILTNKPTYFLSSIMRKDSKYNRFYYIVEVEGKRKLENFLTEQKEEMQDVILNIFESLFKNEKKIPQGSIRWTDKYVNYMCLGVPQNKVSDLEFATMISAPIEVYITNGMYAIIREWCLSGVCKKDLKSIYDHFAQYKINRNLNDETFRYVCALFYWFEFNENYKEELIIGKILEAIHKDIYNIEFHEELRVFIVDRFNHLLIEKLYEKVAVLCTRLYSLSGKNVLLVTNDDIKNIMNVNIMNLLKSKKWDPINLVTDDGNKLNLVFSLSCISYKLRNGEIKYENPLAMDVINWLTLNAKRSKHIDALERLFGTILSEKKILGEKNNIQRTYLEKLWGTDDAAHKLALFKANCFTSN